MQKVPFCYYGHKAVRPRNEVPPHPVGGPQGTILEPLYSFYSSFIFIIST